MWKKKKRKHKMEKESIGDREVVRIRKLEV